jgi:hypothetical protein
MMGSVRDRLTSLRPGVRAARAPAVRRLRGRHGRVRHADRQPGKRRGLGHNACRNRGPRPTVENRCRCVQCPRASPIAFADYRSAGAALCLSPRGDLHTDICAAPGSARGRHSCLRARLFPARPCSGPAILGSALFWPGRVRPSRVWLHDLPCATTRMMIPAPCGTTIPVATPAAAGVLTAGKIGGAGEPVAFSVCVDSSALD